ncbi:MAG: helix-turn-helix transcriptional regulator [Clostridia bacterium]|nr:helix-turn-helix transcriptional regulator [Deltaproteobacteria bacterium]
MADWTKTYADRAKFFKALSDPRRLHIVDLLTREDNLCGVELAKRLGISIALLSHHWKILTDAGVICQEKSGQTKTCSLQRDKLRVLLDLIGLELEGLSSYDEEEGGPQSRPERSARRKRKKAIQST